MAVRSACDTKPQRVSPRRRSAAAAVLALSAVLILPVIAAAHAMLESSNPAAGAQLSTVPRSIRLTFTETPSLTFTRVQLFDSSAGSVALDSAIVAPDSKRAVLVGIRDMLVAGSYTVGWRTAGDDGHPTHGRFTFTVLSNALGVAGEVTPGRSAAPAIGPASSAIAKHDANAPVPEENSFGTESPLYVAIRWLQFTALLLVVGAVAFRLVVLGFMARERAPRAALIERAALTAAHVGLLATAALGVTALLRLAAQSYAMRGLSDVSNGAFVGTMLARTVWGWGWLIQIAAVVIALAGFARARFAPGTEVSRSWMLATLGAVVLAFTPAISGHAVSAPHYTSLAVLADGFHVMGAGGWLGSLLYVVVIGIPAALRLDMEERGPAVADLVNSFSPTALTFAGLTAATGVFAAWLHLGAVNALWQTAYGRTLLVKLAVLSIVAATGAYNWLRVRPALGDIEGARRVRRSASVELAIGVIVLALTAVLVATPTPLDLSAMHAVLVR